MYTCQHCGSENTQRISLLYDMEKIGTKTNTLGVGGGTGLGLFGARSGSTSQSKFMMENPPPKRRKFLFLTLLAIIVLCIAQNWITISLATLYIFIVIRRLYYNLFHYSSDVEEWNHQYVCLRCGDIFND